MLPLNTVTLLVNGLTLSLALGFLLIVLWYDVKSELNQFFAIFLFLVTAWNIGSLLNQAVTLIDPTLPLIGIANGLMGIGVTGSSVAIYVLTATLIGTHSKRFRWIALVSLVIIASYQLFLIVNRTQQRTTLDSTHSLQSPITIFYLTFNTITFYLLWRYRKKIRSRDITAGIFLFLIGQALGFLNPTLPTNSFSINISSLGTLVLSFGILRQEMIIPLTNRISQVEAMHNVSLAITSQIALDTVLNEIAVQAAGWLDANGSAIFLNTGDCLQLATVHNLPQQFLHSQVPIGEGVTGKVAQTHTPIHLENYARDWTDKPDLPLAKETFGSVICVPLIYADEVIGVLIVIAGIRERLFNQEDVHLLQLLGSQAAVAIAHSQLFAEQHELTREVESSRSQLETVLISTENPVIAVNRLFHLIFANPAARNLFAISHNTENKLITDLLPATALPELNRRTLRNLRRKNVHVYEIAYNNKVYLCHVASLGRPRMEGWVAVLNDITQLKELDRLKSEMVRLASHDLKNPLTGAMLHLDLLSEDLADENNTDNADLQETIQVIERQLERMNRIIRGILDLERLDTGTLTAELCYPARLVERAIEEMQYLADNKSIHLKTDIEDNLPQFLGDSNQFERALINLVENAIKFTPASGQVSILVSKDKANILFQVKDTGIGISEQIQKQIFDRFFRGGASGQIGAEQVGGSGLGLSLVKSIVEKHQGTIWVESEERVGSTFFVSVPIYE